MEYLYKVDGTQDLKNFAVWRSPVMISSPFSSSDKWAYVATSTSFHLLGTTSPTPFKGVKRRQDLALQDIREQLINPLYTLSELGLHQRCLPGSAKQAFDLSTLQQNPTFVYDYPNYKAIL